MIDIKCKIDFNGYTVIIPSVGVGNAAQLAIDLIIATLKLKRIGNISHEALIPIFGESAFQHDNTNKTNSCELYVDEQQKLLIVQIRSPFISRHINSFHQELVAFLKEHDVQRVLLLDSCFGYEKHTIESSSFEYIPNSTFYERNKELLVQLTWNKFIGTKLPGGGNGLKLMKVCTDNDIPTLLLFKYVMEGDNTPDAAMLVNEIGRLCNNFELEKENDSLKLVVPVSWRLLFGNEPGDLIF